MLGALSMFVSLMFWGAMAVRRVRTRNNQLNQMGGAGDDKFYTININDGKSSNK